MKPELSWNIEKVPVDVHEFPIELYHSVKYKDLKSFPYAKFNISLKILKYTKEEYRLLFKDRFWSEEESDLLLKRVENFELNFIILREDFIQHASLGLLSHPIEKYTIEQLRDRFFSIQEKLIISRLLFLEFLKHRIENLHKINKLTTAKFDILNNLVSEEITKIRNVFRQYSNQALSGVTIPNAADVDSLDGCNLNKDDESVLQLINEICKNTSDLYKYNDLIPNDFSIKLYNKQADIEKRLDMSRAFSRTKEAEKLLANSLQQYETICEEIEKLKSEQNRRYKKAQNVLEKFKSGIVNDGLIDTLSVLEMKSEQLCDADLSEDFKENCVLVKKADNRLLSVKRLISPTNIIESLNKLKDNEKEKVLLRSELLLESVVIPVLGTTVVFPLTLDTSKKYEDLITKIHNGEVKAKDVDETDKESLKIYLSTQVDIKMTKMLGKDKFFVNTETIQAFYEKFCVDLSVCVALEYKLDKTLNI